MTLVLTVLTAPYVQQAADRLVSLRGKPHDPEANKTIVFIADDAVATIAYTGLAELEGMPTDEFIASALAGQPMPDGHCR